jgi:putative tryptophan/tyrosine transport system substrate-binding protein
MVYAVDPRDLIHRAAGHVDRVLRGDRPGDLPVQQPTKYQRAINLKTVKGL